MLTTFLQPKQEKPIKDAIDQYRPTGEEFDKAYSYDVQTRTDDTEISAQQVPFQKIAVSRSDIRSLDEAEKPRYPKHVDVGRLVIEEIPEEKIIPDRETVQRETLRHKITEIASTKTSVEEQQTKYVKEGVVRAGKLETTDFDGVTRESRRAEEKLTTQREIIDARKVRC